MKNIEYKGYIIKHDAKHYLVFKKKFKKVEDRFPMAICEDEKRAEQYIDNLKEDLNG